MCVGKEPTRECRLRETGSTDETASGVKLGVVSASAPNRGERGEEINQS